MGRIYLYPVWVRIWHLINALLCLILIYTGLNLQYSSQDFIMVRFDFAVSLHNFAGIALSISYIFFIAGNLFTKNGKYYRSWYEDMKERSIKQLRYYTIGIFRGEKPPFPVNVKRKFNPLQKVAYVLIMYFFMPVLVVTGWGLFYPDMIIHNIFGLSGLHVTDIAHIVSGFVVSVFLFVHIYLCTLGTTPSSNFRSMINGWHE